MSTTDTENQEIILEEKEDLFEHYRIIVDHGQTSIRIDKYLFSHIANVSRNKIQNAAKSGCILVNDQAVKSNYKVRPNDIISVVFPDPPRDSTVYPENISINIVYEDNEILIVNKRAGMVVHPAYSNYTGTLVNALLYHLGAASINDDIESTRAGLVHRIDKNTSGLLVIAKTDYALGFLAKQFYDHNINRKYYALVWGNPVNNAGTVRTNIARDPRDRKKMKAFRETDIGKEAVTHYKVLERFGYVTLIECVLETGRTHQIRVHMSSIGHPIFNDETYGGAEIITGPSFTKYKQFINNCFEIIPRQALHAKELGFIHPGTKKEVFFNSELPEDMQAVVDKWRKYSNTLSLEE
jgi:23S rRNA pseudouridine1911/1915/1917 synthase